MNGDGANRRMADEPRVARPKMRAMAGLSAILSAAIMAAASVLGLAAFLYPFFLPAGPVPGTAAAGGAGAFMAHANDAPLLTVVLLLLCLGAVFAGLTEQGMTSKRVAVLGVLTAVGAVLRAVPGPAGFNAVFLLPILAGYCYGSTFGFLLGAMSLLVSALIGGGVGPWLPYQMYATGWMGLLSGWLPRLRRHGWAEAVMLSVWGFLLGLLFGAIMNIWFWPFLAGAAQAEQGWRPGLPIWGTLRSYALFYVATSLWWDLARSAGNAVLILLLGVPVLRVLRRFRQRFQFEAVPEVAIQADGPCSGAAP